MTGPFGNSRVLQESDLRVGDVLLCYSSAVLSNFPEISEATDSTYSHAAISLGAAGVGEAGQSGVRKTTVSKMLDECDHIAVFRNPFAWNERREALLIAYVESAIAAKAGFNR